MATDQLLVIRACLRAICQHTPHGADLILVGGAGGIIQGSTRTTSDVDLLLAATVDPHDLHRTLLALDGFSAPGGMLTFTAADDTAPMTIDFLKSTVLEKTYDDIVARTFVHGDADSGVALLNPDVALAIKLHCFVQRADDANGESKKKSDLQDIVWLASKMAVAKGEGGQGMSESVAAAFPIGHYHLLLTRLALSPAEVATLVEVGVKKMLRPWDEDTAEQKEYFSYFAEPGTCPLTGELFDE